MLKPAQVLILILCAAVPPLAVPHGEVGHVHGSGPPSGASASQTVTGPKFQKQVLDEHFWSEGVASGDINRDGKNDIIAGPFWYAGPDFQTRHEFYPASESFTRSRADGATEQVPGFEGALGQKNAYSDNFFTFVGDFNGDEWPDILVFGAPGKQAVWFENPGKQSRPWTRHVALERIDNESPAFVDVDRDGKEEIVAVSGGYLGYAKPAADPTRPWMFHRISGNEARDGYTHGLGVGDVNGDGRVDVLEAGGWWEQPASLGGDEVWRRHALELGKGAQYHVYDVNGDGRNDIVGSLDARGYGLAWWEQRKAGGGISFKRHLILQPAPQKKGVQFSQLHAVQLADIDGDGLKDIVTGKRFWAHGPKGDPEPTAPAVLYWFKLQRDGGRVTFVPHLIDDDSGVGTQLTVADVNTDGFLDVVVANKKGVFVHKQKFGGLFPKDAARAMSLPLGFEAVTFAAEPDVKQPIAFTIDDRGRLWVVEAYTYPVRRPEGQGVDRILVFEDSNGDGKFDKRTVFMSGLNLVSGIEVGFGGVWIGAAPYLLYVPMKDGDEPRPAGEPQILLDGWGHQDTHETLNTFMWGPDGWLYGSHGVFTNSNVGKPGTPEAQRQKINAGVWRYHPTKHRFEVFAHGTSNPWGMDFTSQGQLIAEACVIPHLWHFAQEGRYQVQQASPVNLGHFNRHTYADIQTIADHVHYTGSDPHGGNNISDAEGGGHAHAGLMIYQGGSWPEEYRGHAYINNIHGARINVDALTAKGSSFIGSHRPDFIRFNDPWSQIVNLQYDQDGSVYMIDWYDQEQCHVNNPDVVDRGNGRIFKVIYRNTPATRIDMQRKSDEQLLADVTDRREWRSRHARRVLQERAARGALTPRVKQYLRGALGLGEAVPTLPGDRHYAADSLDAKLRLLWALHVVDGLSEADALRLTSSGEEYIRAWAIQLATEDGRHADAAMTVFAKLAATDSSPVVRRYLATAALRSPPEKRWDLLQALHARGEDANDPVVPLLNWYGLEPLIGLDLQRSLAIGLASKMPRTLEFVSRRATGENTSQSLLALTRALATVQDEPRQLAILSGMHAGLQGQRNVVMPQGWLALEQTFARSAKPEIRNEALAVSLVFGTPSSLSVARGIVANTQENIAARRAALTALLNVRDARLQPLLPLLLKETELRRDAIRASASFNDPQTPDRLLALYPSLPAVEKREVLTTLASRAVFAKSLV
ncbi:PVC-type heme-binding CxxCH protein, partial [Steroidobacter sp.]|uniref:PVC-type heme-binding CxxCH protein n=1 Tax=Steroidobacter sp. TaxID=1978227 RepID=UPI001A5ED55E